MATAVQSQPPRTDSVTAPTVNQSLLSDGAIPSDAMLRAASDLPIYDAQGNSHPFETLYATPGQKHLVVFIRHFFCGMCQDFVSALSTGLPPSRLSELSPPATLTIIGCGDPKLITDYYKNAKCRADMPIYADPSCKLYETLNLVSNLSSGAKKPEYQTAGLLGLVTRSIVQGVRAGANGLKGGPVSQDGGEFLFQEGRVVWCHRMTNTRDHSEVAHLKKVLGA